MTKIVKKIWGICLNSKIKIQAAFIPGKNNVIADYWSRKRAIRYDFKLDQAFERIVQRWGRPRIDLFASQRSKKVRDFFSLNQELGSLGTDAFKQNWGDLKGYAFPPVKLIGRVLQKIRADQADLILVTPY